MTSKLFCKSSHSGIWLGVILSLFISGISSAQSSPFVLSWDKTGCQQGNIISEINFDDNFSNAPCLKVCPESTTIYRMTGEAVQNVETIEWRVTGGKVDTGDKLSTPIYWDSTGSGSITIVLTLLDGTNVERTLCVSKSSAELLFGWDKTGCQENKDNVNEIKFDESFPNSECLRVCKGSSIQYQISGDETVGIATINWYITGGYAFITNELSTLITWSNVIDGSIRVKILFNDGGVIDRTICVKKWESSVLLGWEKIDEKALCEIKYDNSVDNSDCILIEPNTTIPYTITGKNTMNVQTIEWNITGGYAYTPNQLSTLITWYGEEEEKNLQIIINYNDGEVVERKINVANYNRTIPGGGQNAQTSIAFDYDNAGNQIKRRMIFLARHSKPKDDSDNSSSKQLVKSEEYSDISYYPNPVKSELYLKWKENKGLQIKGMELYDLNGRIVYSFMNQQADDHTTINFETYPEGIYELILNYVDGDKKTLKIVKQ